MNLEELTNKINGLLPGERIEISGVPEDIYHLAPGIGSTQMKAATKSMADYKATVDEVWKRNASMLIGSATHTLVLEGDLFDEKYIKQPPEIKQRRVGTAKYDAFLKANPGKEVLSESEFEAVGCMADSIFTNVGKYFTGGDPEKSFWYRHENGLLLKARVDYVLGDAAIDLKTGHFMDKYHFARTIKYEYAIQDEHYRMVSGLADMIFVCVDNKPSWCCYLAMQGEEVRERSKHRIQKAMKEIIFANEFKKYPHNPVDLIVTDLTEWEKQNER